MAIDSLDIRMARLEGGYAQVNERLGALEDRLTSLVGEMGALRTEFRTELNELRRQMTTQFYWVLTLVLGSILISFIRDFVR